MTLWTWYLSQPRGLTDATDTLTDDSLMSADGEHPGQSHLSFSSTLTTLHTIPRSLSSTLTTSGVLRKSSSRSLGGNVSPTGALTWIVQYRRNLTGDLDLSGELISIVQYRRTLSSSLSFTGTLARVLLYRRTLTSSLSFTGALSGQKAFLRGLSSNLSLSGLLRKLFQPVLSRYTATLTLGSTQTRKTFKQLGTPPRTADAADVLTDAADTLTDGYQAGSKWIRLIGRLTAQRAVRLSGTVNFSGSLVGIYKKYEAPAATYYYWPELVPDSTEYRISIRRRR